MKVGQRRISGRFGFRWLLIFTAPLLGRDCTCAGAPPEPVRPTAGKVALPHEAVGRLTLPRGFRATLCASEPDVVQPIAMTIDPRGRLWVVENMSYPIWLGGPRGKDRILIFEDVDGDGRFDRRTVFYDHGTSFTGIELGFGGVWICATPSLLFIPDRDGDDRPDGAPIVKLDGWDTRAQHNMFNAIRWGPDGWLWGCNGIMSNSLVGKPGTPPEQRTPINCGVWRYHPVRGVFEAVAHGTTNPWGLDFDDFGEAFITNCVIPHLFRVVPGSRFQRMYGNDLNPFAYDLMETCADHLHWAGGRWQDSREGRGQHGVLGGGHAHVGAMIYLADNWPATYHNTLFTCNIHGRRVNNDRFEYIDDGSRIVARHNPDFLLSTDPWFRGMELKYGPDGGVYLTDWSDTGECHETDADNAHRETGRIFKVTYGDVHPVKIDLALKTDLELARLQVHPNEWYVRTARRLLQERAAAGKDLRGPQQVWRGILATDPNVRHQLRAVWAAHVTGGLDETARLALLAHASPQVRAWGPRLLLDQEPPSAAALKALGELASRGSSPASRVPDSSALVRLYLASALQRIPAEQRWPLAEAIVTNDGSTADHNHTLLIWYGLEPLLARDGIRAVALLLRCPSSTLRRFIARRLVAADAATGLAWLLPALEDRPQSFPSLRLDVLDGMLDALRGQKRADMPKGWPPVFARLVDQGDPVVRARAAALGLLFGDPHAEAQLRSIVSNRTESSSARQFALQNLVERRTAGLAPSLMTLLNDPDLRGAAIRALAAYNDPATPEAILRVYPKLAASERDDAVATLASRPAWALTLLDAVRRGAVPRRDLSTSVARQILEFRASKLTSALQQAWGTLRPTSPDKANLIAKYKAIMASSESPPPSLDRGRALYDRICSQCHRLFGHGGDVGPDLTGSDRANPDYILENVLDPSATVGKDYTLTNVATTDGRLVSGILREQTPSVLVIQTASERITLPRDDVETIKSSNVSMMPEGQLEPLTPQEVRDLFAYMARAEAPMPIGSSSGNSPKP
jgi:putative membrane-bound dehydrogenase-like protein